MELNFSEIRELLTILNQTDIAEITIKSSDFELTVRKDVKASDRALVSEATLSTPPVVPPPVAPAPPPLPIAPITPPSPPPAPPSSDKLVDVTSPMVGTFYCSPTPDEAPFVAVGDRIQVGQTLCIIEAMKLMNEIEAEVAGEIVEILVQNAEPVEYGQILMRVKPG